MIHCEGAHFLEGFFFKRKPLVQILVLIGMSLHSSPRTGKRPTSDNEECQKRPLCRNLTILMLFVLTLINSISLSLKPLLLEIRARPR